MINKHFDWNEIWFTKMVDKSADVAILSSINAVSFTILKNNISIKAINIQQILK